MNEDETNPYVGTRPFQEKERDRFFGRDREIRELLALTCSERIVLFYAQSGAGKTSLINARLVPDLRARGYHVFPVGRVGGDAPEGMQSENIYVFNLIRTIAPQMADPADLQLSDFFGSVAAEAASEPELGKPALNDQRHILIIDQFEELFSSHHEEWKKREDFLNQLAQALQKSPDLSVLLAMREDYIAWLDPHVQLFPNRLRIRYYMQRLERNRALEAIKGPVKTLRPFADGAAETLVENLASIKVLTPDGRLEDRPGQFVEPVHLQVVCQNLWQNLPAGGSQITEKDIHSVGDVNTSLGNYYAAQVKIVAEQKNVSERKIRRWFSEKLISPGGIRTMVLREPGERSSGLENEVIRALPHLIRVEQRGGTAFYELTHDRLVEPILINNKKWEEKHSSPLQRQAALWKDQKKSEGWLLIDQALSEVEEWAKQNPDELSEDEEEFLEASRDHQEHANAERVSRQRELEVAQEREREQKLFAEEQQRSARKYKFASAVAWCFLALASIFLGFAYVQWRDAEKNGARALIADAVNLRALGRYEESIENFLAAQRLDQNAFRMFEYDVLSSFCFEGSLFEDPSKFQQVCNEAVNKDSENGIIRERRGINRVLLEDFPGAIVDFEYAVDWYREQKNDQLAQVRANWIKKLESGNNPLDKKTLNVLKAQVLAESAVQLNNNEQYEEMIDRFLQAQRLDSNVVDEIQDAGTLNNICWFGSLRKYAWEVREVCEKATTLEPVNGNFIDSRGLNRALLGDYPGAIADFQFAVEWFGETDESEALIKMKKRQDWIAALQNHQNPFDDATLKALLTEGLSVE